MSLLPVGTYAQAKAPVDFSGEYVVSAGASQALTESKGLTWRGASAGADTGDRTERRVTSQTTTIVQDATHLTIDSRLGELMMRTRLALDGTESVNVDGDQTERSRSRWVGKTLVTSGIRYIEVDGRPIERHFTATRMLTPDGHIHIETRTRTVPNGAERVRWTVLHRSSASKRE